MMKLIYIASGRIPTEKAHGCQIMKMCEAFAKNGLKVTLVLPRRYQINQSLRSIKDPFTYYHVEPVFSIRRLMTIDLLRFDSWFKWLKWPLFYIVQELSFACAIMFYLMFTPRSNIVYSRSLSAVVGAIILCRSNVYYEAHECAQTEKAKRLTRFILARVTGIIAITHHLKEDLIKVGLSDKKIMVASDAVDPVLFKDHDRQEARKKTGLPADKKIILYTGNLYLWKGVHTLAEASVLLPENTVVVFVGGSTVDRNIREFEDYIANKKLDNIIVTGHKPPAQIPTYLAAANVLVLPNSGKEAISARYTSPLKLYEYMAARRVIVASRLPSICEELDDEKAVLVEPDNISALAQGIKIALEDEEGMSKKISNAFNAIQGKTWEARAGQIMSLWHGPKNP